MRRSDRHIERLLPGTILSSPDVHERGAGAIEPREE
jgi:hypothetical protein